MGSGTDTQMRQIACQELLTRDGVCAGWLRGKTILHKLGEAVDEKINRPGFAKQLTSKISWQRRYVVVVDGYLHIYTNETSKRPAKVIDLCGFHKVERDEILNISEVPWPFKISSEISKKVMKYGAMSEPEMKKWIEAVSRGIEEAKQSGRKPVINEKKESIPNRMKKPEKPLPDTPVVPDDYDDGAESDYDYIPDLQEEHEQKLKQSNCLPVSVSPRPSESPSSSDQGYSVEYESSPANGMHPKVEPKKSTLARKEMPVPHTPVENLGDARANLKKVLSKQLGSANSKPAVPKKNILSGPSTHARPAVPVKNSQSNLDKKTVLKVSVRENNHSDEEGEVEYELLEDSIVTEATWTGPAEEGTKIMQSIKEEGAFMIRDSTTGQGDQTLQVLSADTVRKYKIIKEGNKFRMGGGGIFDSMAELLTFYQKNDIPNHSTKLTKPYSKVLGN